METTGDIVCDGNAYYSTVTGISAAGATQGTATALLSDVNNVTTVAAGSGVILTTTAVGSYITVLNSGANALLVYPPVGGTIDGQATNTPISVPVSQVWSGSAVASLTWETLVAPVYPTTNQTTVTYSGGAIAIGVASNPIWPGTASETIPVGTTAQRPGTPTVGMFRYNSTTGMYELYDTSWGSLPMLLDKSTTNVVQTSTTAANFFSYSVPANTLGTAGILHAKAAGIWAVTGGTARTSTWTLSYGATTLWSATTTTLASGSTVSWDVDVCLVANNSTSAQTMSGRVHIGAALTTGVSAGVGTITNSGTFATTIVTPWTSAPVSGTSAIASTSAQTFQLTCTSSGTGSTVTCYYHSITLL